MIACTCGLSTPAAIPAGGLTGELHSQGRLATVPAAIPEADSASPPPLSVSVSISLSHPLLLSSGCRSRRLIDTLCWPFTLEPVNRLGSLTGTSAGLHRMLA